MQSAQARPTGRRAQHRTAAPSAHTRAYDTAPSPACALHWLSGGWCDRDGQAQGLCAHSREHVGVTIAPEARSSVPLRKPERAGALVHARRSEPLMWRAYGHAGLCTVL